MSKVKDGLSHCGFTYQRGCAGCPYEDERNKWGEIACTSSLATDALKVIDRPCITWMKASDKLPDKSGDYLVVKKFFGFRKITVFSFSTNLHSVDEYDFPDEKRPGWYGLSFESGYYEESGITHWAELPDFPDD